LRKKTHAEFLAVLVLSKGRDLLSYRAPDSAKAENQGKYGLHYFDKPGQGLDEQEEEDDLQGDEFDLQACERDCCDIDCECDDCQRCSTNGLRTDDDPTYYGAAAA
jgi:hypothetical protein